MGLPKGKAFALIAVFAAIGLATATGAFTTATAERTATVNVQGDSSALLAIESTDSPNGDYVDDSGNQVSIDLSTSNGAGVNYRADTDVERMMNITNQGTQPVAVYIEPLDSGTTNDADNVALYTNQFDASTTAHPDISNQFGPGDVEDASEPNELLTGQASRVVLESGETLTVSMYVNLRDSNGNGIPVNAETGESTDDVLDSVVIHADAEAVEGAYDPDLE